MPCYKSILRYTLILWTEWGVIKSASHVLQIALPGEPLRPTLNTRSLSPTVACAPVGVRDDDFFFTGQLSLTRTFNCTLSLDAFTAKALLR